jgi:flagellar basal-body rod protein FlgG
VFEDLMYQNLRQAGAAVASRRRCRPACRWVWALARSRNRAQPQQGNLQQSSNNLDVANRGNGLFEIQLPDGTPLHRDGSFQVSSTGLLVTNTATPSSPASPSRRRPRA